ncbi:RES family NAD+ phosphorylase [Mycobacterium sp. M1]|uniref:RES family NAD+ phosphorylase n=1 Tax=Mycolicibacter acidiphilus TaxID=2835306 RepID=A0ABS5RG77_9MYCO|nr:RES family NAD+ phosphorylase [Mycolicibacter acidiphilus]MBS9533291.1 RES family NAD+ phosphorylase [Mycolicibacter acidiphilus]
MSYTAFRHAAYDSPWWSFPSGRSGRFHRAGVDIVQYLALHPLGPAAEMLRHNVGPHGDPDEVVLNLWVAELDLERVVRIDFADATAHGCTAADLVGDDYAPTQALAERMRATGADAMIVPSAALAGTDNLIVFGIRVLHPYLWEPVTPEEVRTGHLSDAARPAAEVAAHVRWFGAPHRALQQWQADGRYDRFDDPVAGRW